MRVLQICNKAPYPPNDGSSIAIYNIGMGMIANRIELHVLTINTKKHFKEDALVPEEYKKKSHYRSVYTNSSVNPAGALANLFSDQSYFVSRFNFHDFESALIEKLNETDSSGNKTEFDIIQLDGLFVGSYIDTIRKYSKAKIVLRAHNVEYLIWERHLQNEKPGLKKWYLNLQTKRLKNFELKVLRQVDAIVSITDFDKTIFKELNFEKPIYTCITGVDINAYKTEGVENINTGTIFYFSSMDWMPNQEAVNWFLANCWKEVHQAIPEAKLVIAGRYMPEYILRTNLPNVQIIENVKDARSFYNEHEIMLVPLLSGSGLRIKIIEGMAYGKAIVSTSIGAEGIKIESGKNILIADSASAFSNAVIELLKHPEKRKLLEKNAREFAENEFDNKKVVAGLVEFYNSLLNA
jgi:glycosyltransferase involved in cell wall biosynthesis